MLGLGNIFTSSNGTADPRNGATAAEREDRTIARENGNNSLAAAAAAAQSNGVSLHTPSLATVPNPLSSNPYAAMGLPSYMRSSMVGGR